jgi:O-antigen/teichoic acid export membrane protein
MQSENNKRIAKNTFLLYIRMFLTMGVSLYTSRIVLNTLGIEDFGIYNVVGGVVIMFSFLNSSMSSATQRFLSFELGKKDYIQLKKVFSMSVNIHAIIALSIFILAETIGLWFLNNKLIIPVARIDAAHWVFQFSILSFIVTVMSVPYDASIIAHERMNIYAYVSIVEVILKLLIVFLLVWFGFDKLKMYSVFIFFVSIFVWSLYKIYNRRKFPETIYTFFWDKTLYKTLMSYAGWNLFGNIAGVAMGQGVNILLNMFFGPVVNAARGIAFQVRGAVIGFVSNFQMAMNPQIVKSYATGDKKYMHQIIFQGSKFSFFLLFFIALPILLETQTILIWWLKIVPDYTIIFCKLILINVLIDCISGPLGTSALATGKIKYYQILIGGLQLIILPISYFLLAFGNEPQATLYVSITISLIAMFGRLYIISPLIDLSIIEYTKSVLFPILVVTLLSFILPLLVEYGMTDNIYKFVLICITSFFSVIFSVIFFGLKRNERILIRNKIYMYFNKTTP